MFQLEIIKGYNYESFREDIKTLMRLTGVDGMSGCFDSLCREKLYPHSCHGERVLIIFIKLFLFIIPGKSMVFYFPDSVIIDERFLEDVNNVLNAGEVPNLFETDERQKILDDMSPVLTLYSWTNTTLGPPLVEF